MSVSLETLVPQGEPVVEETEEPPAPQEEAPPEEAPAPQVTARLLNEEGGLERIQLLQKSGGQDKASTPARDS